MSSISIRLLTSTLLGIFFLSTSYLGGQSYEIVLRVNERIATTYDYQRRRAENLRVIRSSELSQEVQQEYLANLGVATMSDLFQEMLLLSRADQLGVRAEESEIREMMEDQKKSFGIETDAQFREALAASNMTVDDMRANLARDIMLQKVVGQEVHAHIKIGEEDLRRYYQSNSDQFQEDERLHLQEVVLLGSSGLKADDLILLASEIRQQLINGGTLEEVAAPYVEQGLSTSVVDLGWVSLGDLDRDLEEAVWSLEEGDVSEAIPGRGGLHILQVAERQEAELRSFSEVRDQIEVRERTRRLRDEMAKYAVDLESRAYIVANPPPEAAGFRASLQTGPTAADTLSVALTAPLMTEPEAPEGDQTIPAEAPGAIPTGGGLVDKDPDEKEVDPGRSGEGLAVPTGGPASIPTGGPVDKDTVEEPETDNDASEDSSSSG